MTSEGDEGEGDGLGGSGVLDVSRSGRVRKKNSLLAAYESLDEVDKPKKKGERGKRRSSSNQKVPLPLGGSEGRLTKKGKKPGHVPKRSKMGPGRGGGGSHKKLFPGGDSLLGDGDLEMDLPPEYDNIGVPNLGDDSPGYSSSDIDDRTNGNGRYSYHNKNKSQAHSTYMEKEKSFGVVKNKKAGTGPKKTKVVKKEKSPRVTAYTLWAKDQREYISKKYPHLDAASLSRKLSEIWQTTIPPNQRKMWKNKADKILRKNLNIKNSAPIIPPPGKGKRRGRPRIHPIPTDGDSFGLNGSASTKIIRRVGNYNSTPGNLRTPSAASKPAAGKRSSIPKSVTSNGVSLSPKEKSSHGRNHLSITAAMSSPFSATKQLSPRKDDDFVYKVTGTAPIDVAAHFALLGESLSIIGERLMDVERQPVSGSLSVLMDSLLCAITPLVCLTQQVPELNCIPPERLTRLLDHIAYIMPGL